MDNAKTAAENLAAAKELFLKGGKTCVIYRSGIIFSSEKNNLAPLIDCIESGVNASNAAAADKIIGKAAAMLLILLGVTAVYTPLITTAALKALTAHKIRAEYAATAPNIQNRSGTGLCPMEIAVANISDPAQAYDAIKKTIAALRK